MTTFTKTFDTNTPLDGDDPGEADDRMREIKAATQERENVDHYWPLTGTEVSDADTGEHRKVTLRVGSAPTKAADKGILYAKDVSSKAELFYIDEDGNEVQLTSAGSLPQTFPAGAVTEYAGSSAPSGWLLCDGSAVSRTTYAALFAVISTTFGVGDGSTTFNLPDMQGRVPLGVGTGDAADATAHTLAQKAGTETHTLTEAEMPSHDHNLKKSAVANSGTSREVPTDTGTSTPDNVVAAGGDGAHNNLQPYLGLNFIIKT